MANWEEERRIERSRLMRHTQYHQYEAYQQQLDTDLTEVAVGRMRGKTFKINKSEACTNLSKLFNQIIKTY